MSEELRRVEFELQRIGDAAPAGRKVRGSAYALYRVCERVDGTCHYRRQDIDLVIQGEGKEGEITSAGRR